MISHLCHVGYTRCAHYTPRVHKVQNFLFLTGKKAVSLLRYQVPAVLLHGREFKLTVKRPWGDQKQLSALFLRHVWSQRLKRSAKQNESATQFRCSAELLSARTLGRTHLRRLHTAHLNPLHPPPGFLIKNSACVLRANEYRCARSLELS